MCNLLSVLHDLEVLFLFQMVENWFLGSKTLLIVWFCWCFCPQTEVTFSLDSHTFVQILPHESRKAFYPRCFCIFVSCKMFFLSRISHFSWSLSVSHRRWSNTTWPGLWGVISYPLLCWTVLVVKLSSEKKIDSRSPLFCQRRGRMTSQELFLFAFVAFRVRCPQIVFENKS